MIKGTRYQEDITLLNICVQGAPQYIKQLLIEPKGETDKTHSWLGTDIFTLLTALDRSSKLKINKQISALNNILDQMAIIDIYRPFYPRTSDYTFFSSAHGTFSRTDHKLGQKTSLKNLRILKSYQTYSPTIML